MNWLPAVIFLVVCIGIALIRVAIGPTIPDRIVGLDTVNTIIVVAMVFLPELRVGGMQIFRSEAFETMGKVLPRAAEIAGRISTIYVVLTIACGFAYFAAGMTFFDSLNFALTTNTTERPSRCLRESMTTTR